MKLIERAGRTRLSLSLSLSLHLSHPSLQPSVTFWTPLNVDLRGQSVTIRKRDMDATAAIIKNNNASSSNESGGVSSALLPPDMRFGEAQGPYSIEIKLRAGFALKMACDSFLIVLLYV